MFLIQATIVSVDNQKGLFELKLEGGTTERLKKDRIIKKLNPDNINIDDVANHNTEINQVDLIFNIKNRFNKDQIFTNVGKSLIIVNPFMQIQKIFSVEMMNFFINVSYS